MIRIFVLVLLLIHAYSEEQVPEWVSAPYSEAEIQLIISAGNFSLHSLVNANAEKLKPASKMFENAMQSLIDSSVFIKVKGNALKPKDDATAEAGKKHFITRYGELLFFLLGRLNLHNGMRGSPMIEHKEYFLNVYKQPEGTK